MISIAHNSPLAHAGPSDRVGPAAVAASGLGKVISGRRVLSDIDLCLPRGSFAALLGANGAGKSTLLRILATLIAPTEGRLELLGRSARGDLPWVRARVGVIGHQLMLYRDLSAMENLEFFGRLYGVPTPRERAAELLEFVGLADRAGDQVKALSRGMAQRVAIARALMHRPELLLADEPFTGLDASASRRLEECLTDLHGRGTTVILAHHQIHQALALADRVLVLRDGRLEMDAEARLVGPAAVLDAMEGAA